jgi:predicted dehydrogenase
MRSDRRSFLAQSLAFGSTPAILLGKENQIKVGIIGSTGRGNYGHGLDVAWKNISEASIVAVADDNDKGRASALKRLNCKKGYEDYRKMLELEKPDFISVCPRHTDQRVPMIEAACENGVKGIYVEKPFARSMEECDRIRKACESAGVKVAVAHRNRYHPGLPVVRRLIQEGVIGKVVALRGRGKEDHRGGGEDLWVLGTHVLDLVHAIAGDPESCSAELRIGGRLVEKSDIKPGNEGLGPLAGDEVHARWKMKNGWTSTFDSIRGHGIKSANFGLQIIGNEGVIDLRCDREPLAHFREGCPWLPDRKTEPWVPISSMGIGKSEKIPISQTVKNHKSALINLIESVEKNRSPLCGLEEGISTVRFVQSVFASHMENGKNIHFPLKFRKHPFLG